MPVSFLQIYKFVDQSLLIYAIVITFTQDSNTDMQTLFRGSNSVKKLRKISKDSPKYT